MCRTSGTLGQNLAQLEPSGWRISCFTLKKVKEARGSVGQRGEVGAGEGAALIRRASPGNAKSPHWRFSPGRNLPLPWPVGAEARVEHLRWGWAARAALAGVGPVSHGQQLGR